MQQPAAVKESVSLKSLRARKARKDLVDEMGGKCFDCPARDSLEFDCCPPKGAAHHFMPWPQRIRFYWACWMAGELELRCKTCHNRKTNRENCKATGVRVGSFHP